MLWPFLKIKDIGKENKGNEGNEDNKFSFPTCPWMCLLITIIGGGGIAAILHFVGAF
ncbi:MAG: hypothetical protein IKQ31_01715 [Clostridia bacterium]|nr:hypothetical protein [Clostridia bacterium]